MRGSPMTSAHSHMKRPTGAEPGRDGPAQGRAGQGRVGPLCWGCGWGQRLGTAGSSVGCNKDWSRRTVLVPSSVSCERISDALRCLRSGWLPPGLPCNSSYPWQHVCDSQTLLLSLELLNAAFQQLRISSLSEGIKCSLQRISLVLSVLKALSGSEHRHPCNWFCRVPKIFLLISTGYS